MTTSAFDALLAQADGLARSSRWQDTYATLTEALTLQADHPGALTGLGTCLLQLNRPTEAVSHFLRVAALLPNAPEAHNNLGLAMALAGRPDAAEAEYRQALACDADHVPAWKNLATLCLQQGRFDEGVPMAAAIVKAHPEDRDALMMLAACYEQGDDKASAAHLYRQVLQQEPDHAEARTGLERTAPVPQPRIARPEHAQKLAALKGLKRPAAVKPARPDPVSVGFFGAEGPWETLRPWAAARWLASRGHRVKVIAHPEPADWQAFDVITLARPHAAPELSDSLAQARRAGKRVVVDLDDDYHRLPPEHPDYATLGPGNAAALRQLEAALAEADLVTTSTAVLAERYAPYARHITTVPDTWDPGNPLWKKAVPHSTLNLGWIGGAAEVEDMRAIRTELLDLLSEFPHAQLVIAGAPAVYALFEKAAEKQRLYLPPVLPEDYPYLLAHFDLLLVPLRDTEYNRSKSARRLLEAGARGIPWLTSPLPAHQAWNAGGLLIEAPQAWPVTLRTLIEDAALRQTLGEQGQRLATHMTVNAQASWITTSLSAN